MRTVEARLKEYYVDEVDVEAPPTDLPTILTEEALSLEKERCVNGGVLPAKPKAERNTVPALTSGTKEENGKKRKATKLLCARPFAQMRGHSAFLTFATAGNAPRADPNAHKPNFD